ncbi:hypothetical protein GCM10009759_45570 [Kitasatospora saccharophila]|uniref:HTH luxR-type domain-containing protein n=1 Tax=Kitasatospora saccharophila TaxID=407973 RepID=A0ABN2X804_9ACTN
MLEFLGLKEDSERVYLAMLENPNYGVAELAEQCRMPPQEIRQALDELVDMDLIQPSRESPGRLRAVSPRVGLGSLLRNRQLELERLQEGLTISNATVQRLIAETDGRDPDEGAGGIKRLVGMNSVQRRLEELSQHAQTECLSLVPGGGQSAAVLESSRRLDEDALRRGVTIRAVYLDSARKDQATMAYARWLAGAGGETRTTPVLASRMVIVDRRVALLPLEPGNSRAGVIQVEEPGVVAALTSWFEEIWSTSVPIDSDVVRDRQNLTGQEREVLRLLGQGLTDEMAGRRLGVSLRTARRMMADLMSRLGAQSRFEAGVKAAEQGWVSSADIVAAAGQQRREA